MYSTSYHTTTTHKSLLVIGDHALKEVSPLVRRSGYTSAMIITDTRVAPLHGRKVVAVLPRTIPVKLYALPPGERSKDMRHLARLLAFLQENKVDRHGVVVALGGGVTGDLAGFAASVYLRGIDCIQVPTSLVGQVDSAIGGKTGVDFQNKKNIIGSFAQPVAIVCDTSFLKTLPLAELVNGMAEVMKYGFIGSMPFVRRLQGATIGRMPWDEVVALCARMKTRIIAQDPYDRIGLRARLNFGHTIGHALESVSNFSLPHGNAIAIGMIAAARMSREVIGLSQQDCERVESLFAQYGLPTRLPPRVNISKVINALQHDKKAKGGKVGWVLLEKLGKARAECYVSGRIVRRVLSSLV